MKNIILLLFVALMLCGCSSAPTSVTSPDTESPIISETIDPVKPALSTPDPTIEDNPAPTQLSIEDVCRAGRMNATTYTNDILGFTATLPEGWQFASQEEIESLYELGKDVNEEAISSMTSLSDNLFFCSKYSMKRNDVPNPYILIVISSDDIGPVTVPKYVFEASLEKQTQLYHDMFPDAQVDIEGEQNHLINGKKYTMISLSSKNLNLDYYQYTYLTEVPNYILTINILYFEEDKDTVETFMKELDFS